MRFAQDLRHPFACVAAFTAFATLAWLAPNPAIKIALLAGGCIAGFAGCARLVCLCRSRTTALLLMASGAYLGWLMCPTVESIRENQIWYDDFAENSLLTVVYAGIGTIVVGAMTYFGERLTQ